MIGEEEWLDDPRFKDDQARADHGEVVSARMSRWCGERSCAEALAALEEASIVAAKSTPRNRLSTTRTSAPPAYSRK